MISTFVIISTSTSLAIIIIILCATNSIHLASSFTSTTTITTATTVTKQRYSRYTFCQRQQQHQQQQRVSPGGWGNNQERSVLNEELGGANGSPIYETYEIEDRGQFMQRVNAERKSLRIKKAADLLEVARIAGVESKRKEKDPDMPNQFRTTPPTNRAHCSLDIGIRHTFAAFTKSNQNYVVNVSITIMYRWLIYLLTDSKKRQE